MPSVTLFIAAKIDPHFQDKKCSSFDDLAKKISQAMAYEAMSLSVRGVKGAAKHSAILRTIKTTLETHIVDVKVGIENPVHEIFLDESLEGGTITIRKRTSIDAMREAVCGK